AAIRRVATVGDGWMGSGMSSRAATRIVTEIRTRAEAAGRDPQRIGMQMALAPPPTDAQGKLFYADLDAVSARASEVVGLGFEWLAVNATAMFQSGSRSVDAMVDHLGRLRERLAADLDLSGPA
ncbi:MAG: hypothetical protein O3C27_13275, partial [Actinomycetota bacterium]|nr:hypothetical protein [Actinomycetota bacterium]